MIGSTDVGEYQVPPGEPSFTCTDTVESRVHQLLTRAEITESNFLRLGNVEDIDEVINYRSQAISLTPDGHAQKPYRLAIFGTALHHRFQHSGELADIDKAIKYQTQALLLTPDGHADKPARLNNLGVLHDSRFERFGEPADVNKAIEYQSQALMLNSGERASDPSLFNNLGNAHGSRFKHFGELEDLNKAIEYQTQAVLLTTDGHADKPARLNNLGVSLESRFVFLGELTDLDKAIEYQTQAVLLTPDGHTDKPTLFHNIGKSYWSRFKRLDVLEDLSKAIEYDTQSVLLSPDGHVEKPNRLNGLGVSYGTRFRRLGELADLNKAIECHTQAVLLTPDGHADKPTLLNGLGNSYDSRFRRLGELTDLDQAIEYFTQALFLSPNDHTNKVDHFNNLGISYASRFWRLGEYADASKAIEYKTQAVLMTPFGHPIEPSRLDSLGVSYQFRFERYGDISDLEVATSLFQTAAERTVTDPGNQFRSARKWAKSLTLLGRSPGVAYARCIELVPHLIWLGTTIAQRYSHLSKVSDLATEAAAWAISVQAFDLAVEWLEEGRSIVWTQILQLRTPFDDLAFVDAGLAEQLKDTASQLERAGAREPAPRLLINTSLDLERDTQHHHVLATQWDQLLQMARKTPGFHNFMRPRQAKELMRAATHSPIVIINVHQERCDALIIRPDRDEITHVPLGSLSMEQLAGTRDHLASLVEHQVSRSRGLILRPAENALDFRRILAILWREITKPILETLGYLQKLPIDELPRVTWCTTGALSFLPLHAAGCYDGVQPNAPDLVVSSYTPTLSALLCSDAETYGPNVGLLAVGQAEYSNGLDNLPGTIDELAAVKDHAKQTRYTQLDGSNATVDSVLSAMDEHGWVHLACHAIQNRDDTSQSAFYLHNGSLTLKAITRRAFKNKGLAFLSACQTATGDNKLPDEALHLAAGMLMAGYPSVIATMWSIRDIDGPEVAREVYAELLKDVKMNYKGAARSLHKAVAGLREKVGQDSFKRWVPFIHIGM